MHAALPISGGQMIMATDTLESMERSVVFGNNYYISLEAENEAEVDKIFAALSAGGTIEVPLNKTFWGAYFGMFADKFGVQWMINYTYPKKS
jgi:PhnB protein